MLIGQLALLAATLFAGAALYVSIAEHPARLEAGPAAGLAQWKPSYRRASFIQGCLALIGGIVAFCIWWQSLNQLWLIGSLLLLANWPYTMLVIMKVNRQLHAIAPDRAGAETQALLVRWGRLHLVRTLLGLASALAMMAALYWRI